MTSLTPRQAEILAFITQHTRERGYPPTVREIGQAVGLASPSTVHAHLAKLAEGGHIARDATKPRAMNVVATAGGGATVASLDAARQARDERLGRLPLVGAVAAGLPRLADEEVDEWVDTPFAADFLLRITGESMRDAGILDGDLVAVKRQQTANNGEIVIALMEDEATCKRLDRRDGSVRLLAENPAFEPIVPDGDVHILGKVVGVLRSL
ncbi:MAG: transcriptional repressor LexA [Thermoleophilia bacterium]|nr:transcriptional repressor LexA [Thermoleophilia bacterium]